jgi:hypothetical protein
MYDVWWCGLIGVRTFRARRVCAVFSGTRCVGLGQAWLWCHPEVHVQRRQRAEDRARQRPHAEPCVEAKRARRTPGAKPVTRQRRPGGDGDGDAPVQVSHARAAWAWPANATATARPLRSRHDDADARRATNRPSTRPGRARPPPHGQLPLLARPPPRAWRGTGSWARGGACRSDKCGAHARWGFLSMAPRRTAGTESRARAVPARRGSCSSALSWCTPEQAAM